MTEFVIRCANCGDEVTYGKHWRNALTGALVCGKQCNDDISTKYAQAICGRTRELEGQR